MMLRIASNNLQAFDLKCQERQKRIGKKDLVNPKVHTVEQKNT